MSKVKKPGITAAAIQQHFPFLAFFANAPQPLFKGHSFAEDWDIAEGCFRHIKKIFEQLEVILLFRGLLSYCPVRISGITGNVTMEGGIRSTVLVSWTAGQQVGQSIRHQGHGL